MEPAIAKSKELNQVPKIPTSVLVSNNDDVATTTSGNDKILLLVKVKQTFNLTKAVKHTYQKDKLYSRILEKPKAHALFGCKDGLIFTRTYYLYKGPTKVGLAVCTL